MTAIKEVYEKYKRLDDLFSDKEFMKGSPMSSTLYDLWQAIKDDQLVAIETKDIPDDIPESLKDEW